MNSKTYILLFLGLFFMSCSNDPCDEGYTEVENSDGSSYCLPDYVAGVEKDLKQGDMYYHKKYGVILWKDGKWQNTYGNSIRNIHY